MDSAFSDAQKASFGDCLDRYDLDITALSDASRQIKEFSTGYTALRQEARKKNA